MISYEEKLERYKARIPTYLNSKYRREREYGSYLKKWFSEEVCDGGTYAEKVARKQSPMSYNIYFMG